MKAMGGGLRNYMLPGTSAFRYVFNEKDYYSERIRNQKVSKASVDLGGFVDNRFCQETIGKTENSTKICSKSATPNSAYNDCPGTVVF